MNQKIKAPGQHIKVDKAEVKRCELQEHTCPQRRPLANLKSKAFLEQWPPWGIHLPRGAHPRGSFSSCCGKQVSIISQPRNTEDKHLHRPRMKTEMNHQPLQATVCAAAEVRSGKFRNEPLKKTLR